MPFFVDIILPLKLQQTYTYLVSETEFEYVSIGMRVSVPFGKTKIYTGIIFNKHKNKPQLYEPKEIHQIIDNFPIVNPLQLQLWQFISEYYMCQLGEVYKAALPSGLVLENETFIHLNETFVNTKMLSDDEYLIVEAFEKQSILKIQEISQIINKKKVVSVIQDLLNKNIISLKDELIETYKPKLIKYVKIHSNYETEKGLEKILELVKNASKQKEIILAYFQLKTQTNKPIQAKQLVDYSKQSAAVLQSIIKKEIFEEYFIQEQRVNFDLNSKKKLQLSNAQQTAFEAINTQFTQKNVCLLHGITASGKTEIYIKLIEKHLENNSQILYLLPEIALTTQLVNRLVEYFGNKVAVFHSKYTNNERVEVWNNVLQNSEEAQIIIGARSSLFLPFSKLKLIIIDEEHEASFKQNEPSPRYHARDTAIYLATICNAKVVLGSATPSLETYYNVQNGKYGLVELFERFGNAILPEINIIDLKECQQKKQLNGHFSPQLFTAINETIAKGEQVILFQNRRGFSPVLECFDCGHVPYCTQCDVSLTYHKFKNQLRCHYCGYSVAKPNSCYVCSSNELNTKGFGTEQIELELADFFPTLTIKRMDQDTTKSKYGFINLIESFKNQDIDILVGTQMLAKGLDFENVTLVGIMNADTMLHMPEFRALEKAFQMMAQVSGRAGRNIKKGKVIIQTYNPQHNIIKQVVQNDYFNMYKEQLFERNLYQYSPFYKMIKITLKDKDYEKNKNASDWFYKVLITNLQIPVLGPEEPVINRIKNEYLRNILIKIPAEKSVKLVKNIILKTKNSFENISQFKSVKIIVNVDFY